MAKRTIEVFSAGCPCCEDAVTLVRSIAYENCDVRVLDMRSDKAAQAKSSRGMWVALGVGGLVALGGIVALLFFLLADDSASAPRRKRASPAQVDVLLYIYEDANAAKSGQEYLRNDDGLYAVMRRLNSGRELRDFDATTGGDPDFGEDSWTAEIKSNPYVENPLDTSIYAMRYANVRAEISVTVQPSVNLHPKDLARSQLQRIQRGSLSAGS